MRTQYKFMHFVKVEDKPKTSVWDCINNRSEATLGKIAWYPPWRQYVFGGFLFANAVFSACISRTLRPRSDSGVRRLAIAVRYDPSAKDCLRDIAEFLDALKAQRAEEKESKQ